MAALPRYQDWMALTDAGMLTRAARNSRRSTIVSNAMSKAWWISAFSARLSISGWSGSSGSIKATGVRAVVTDLPILMVSRVNRVLNPAVLDDATLGALHAQAELRKQLLQRTFKGPVFVSRTLKGPPPCSGWPMTCAVRTAM